MSAPDDEGWVVAQRYASLYLQGQTLFVGYQNAQNGAVGTLDLATHKFSSFIANLSPDAGKNSQPFYRGPEFNPVQPPQQPIPWMTEADPGKMWFIVGLKGLQRFRVADASWRPFLTPIVDTKDSAMNKKLAETQRQSSTILQNPGWAFSSIAADPRHGRVLLTAIPFPGIGTEESNSGGLLILITVPMT